MAGFVKQGLRFPHPLGWIDQLELLLARELAPSSRKIRTAFRLTTIATIAAGLVASCHANNELGTYIVWLLVGAGPMMSARKAMEFLIAEMFCYQLRKHIGALSAALGGLDLLVFTGGIGERASAVRWEVCRGLEYLGITLDHTRNEANADTISTANSKCLVRMIPTNESLMIARHAYRLIYCSHSESAHD